MFRFVLAAVGLVLAPPLAARETTWKAGFAKVSITPDRPMWMAGYAARKAPAEGKETDLWVKAAVLQSADGRKVVLVAFDLVGLDRGAAGTICGRIQRKYQLPREAVVLSVSHTHCGPVVGTTLRTMYFLNDEQARRVDEYTAALPDLVLKAVDAAVGSLAPVTLSWGAGTAGFAVNRRENKEPDVPALREKGLLKGPVDHAVPVLAARDRQGALKGVIFGYACHATVLAYLKWCGDYPGFAAAELEGAHPGAVAVFFAGCGADQNPIPRGTVDRAKDYGKQLAAAVDAVLAKPMAAVTPQLSAVYREIELPLNEVPGRDALVRDSLGENRYIAARARYLLKKLEGGEELPASYPYPVQTWQLGREVTLVALGGEVVVDYALRLRRELGPTLWVMGYANDVMAYIPSARVLREGGYEGAAAMIYYGLPSVWGPKVEDLIVEEVTTQVKRARGE